MRRVFVIAIVAGLLAASAAGCAGETGAATPPAGATPTADTPAADTEAEVYVEVLRRYLGTPSDNSFPDRAFATVYLLDQAFPDAGDPSGKLDRGTPIGPDAQRHITAALAPVTHVAFVADRNTVIETRKGCPQVRDGGILITLGPAIGDDHEVRVAIYGFVACLGATWLTYVVRNHPGTGWRVTGTTGPKAIA